MTPESIPATLIPGDGIGPEISAAVVEILDALGKPFAWDLQQGGVAAAEKTGDASPPALLDSIRRTRLARKGPLTTPVARGFRSVNVRLREEFKLYANLRPARTLINGGRYEDIDIVLVRENLEGFYIGFEHYIPIDGDPHAAAISSGVNTRAGSRRIAEFAFDYASKNDRKKVTIVHKANVLKALSGIFLETAREVARKYEGKVAMDDRIIARHPRQRHRESVGVAAGSGNDVGSRGSKRCRSQTAWRDRRCVVRRWVCAPAISAATQRHTT